MINKLLYNHKYVVYDNFLVEFIYIIEVKL